MLSISELWTLALHSDLQSGRCTGREEILIIISTMKNSPEPTCKPSRYSEFPHQHMKVIPDAFRPSEPRVNCTTILQKHTLMPLNEFQVMEVMFRFNTTFLIGSYIAGAAEHAAHISKRT